MSHKLNEKLNIICFLAIPNIFLVIIGLLMSMPVLFIPPIIACIYVWCNLYKGTSFLKFYPPKTTFSDVIVSFFFGLKFKAIYLLWMLMVFGLIVANDGFNELLGIFIGHTYYFLKFRYPTEFGGPNLLETPQVRYSHLFRNY